MSQPALSPPPPEPQLAVPVPAPAPASIPAFYYACVAFTGGFNVMLLEMCAFRVLQTNFGSSIYVTGVLLALIMIALSLGYFLGGRSSRGSSSIKFLLGMLTAAVAYVVLTGLLFVEPILDFCFERRHALNGGIQGNAFAASLATLLLYVFPMVAMSHVSPFLIKLLSSRRESNGDVGATAGNLMSVSTFGSIAGTLLPSLVFIPTFGVATTLWILVGSIMAVVMVGFVLLRRPSLALAGALLIVVAGAAHAAAARHAATASAADPQAPALVASTESLYGNVKIFRSVDPDGDVKLEYMPSRGYVHSTVYPDHPFKDQFTMSYISVGLARGAKHYLVLGVALGAIVASVLAADPEAEITAVEIDPLIVELAKKFVPSLNSPRVHFVVADARLFLREDKHTYDYLIVDVFAGEQIPPHCVTQEFFALARDHLTDNGILQMNTNLWDFHVLTGLEQPAPFVSVHHIQAALFRDGFASIFQDDFFENGHLYAFRKPMDLRTLRESLAKVVLSPKLDPDLRSALGAAYLAVVPVPPERRDAEPFTDSWVPENQLALKENFPLFLKALAQARQDPRWASVVESKGNTELRLIVARHYAELATSIAPTSQGYKTYMKSASGARFCADVLDWASHTQGDLVPQLALYLQNRVASDCNELLKYPEEVAAISGVQQLQQFMGATALLNDNRGRDALPVVTQAIQRSL